jgi:hypothetical protein
MTHLLHPLEFFLGSILLYILNYKFDLRPVRNALFLLLLLRTGI